MKDRGAPRVPARIAASHKDVIPSAAKNLALLQVAAEGRIRARFLAALGMTSVMEIAGREGLHGKTKVGG
jgi:hypothetical protein